MNNILPLSVTSTRRCSNGVFTKYIVRKYGLKQCAFFGSSCRKHSQGYPFFHAKSMAIFHRMTTQVRHQSSHKNTNLLLKHLQARIRMGGPISVAEYMKEVLTNSLSGYYMHRDVFGAAGDFITSPEISQMFGEMLGVWVVNEWMNHYSDQPLQVVELGPGRGTLADDMLRVFSQFPIIKDKINLNLVEVSPALSRMQAAKLTGENISENSEDFKDTSNDFETGAVKTLEPYGQLTSKYGPKVSWYRNLSDVPHGLSCFIAHEFLDALPIHKFHKTEHGWREVLVDIDASADSLRFVLAPGQTPASVAYLREAETSGKTNIEVCPSAGLIVQEISKRIQHSGGFCLLADYGHTGEKGGTFRAFKNHALHDPLIEPGTADLTADVDFSYLNKFISTDVTSFGPITQARFLNNMGIGLRLQTLLKTANQDQWSSLISGYKMLMSPDQMGERFKFMCIMPKFKDTYVPAGFVDLDLDGVFDRQNK